MEEAKLPTVREKRAIKLVLAFDAVVLGVFWYLIPNFKRPFEGLMALLAILGVITIVVARRHAWLPSVLLVVVSLSAGAFLLETLERHFTITNLAGGEKPLRLGAGPYDWDPYLPATYMAARKRAEADGVYPQEWKDDFKGDVFAQQGIEKGEVRHRVRGKRAETTEYSGTESPWVKNSPVGVELRPNLLMRQYHQDEDTGTILCDGVYTTGPLGFRNTKDNEESDDVFVFTGCSFTFGAFVNDDQTLPYYFSEARGFGDRVLNFGANGQGPHHVLRELQLNHYLGRAGVDPGQVKAVVFSFIDDHFGRVVSAPSVNSPRYVLENGKLKHMGTFSDTGDTSRLDIMMERSRIYPVLKKRLGGGVDNVALTYAIVGEIDRLCRERFGVPLTLVSWSADPGTDDRFRNLGVDFFHVREALGEDWRDLAIRYYLLDGHPAPFANHLIAEKLAERFAGETPE